jgi:hypothetical protein
VRWLPHSQNATLCPQRRAALQHFGVGMGFLALILKNEILSKQ